MDKSRSNYSIKDVINTVGLDSLIEKTPQGTETYLTRNFSKDGVELSGGEGQKLSIARAVYKDAPILILDEPMSSLDPKAEDEIYQTFFKVSDNKTTLFILHRLDSTIISNRIIVIEKGEIVELGNHDELMDKNRIYASMFSK